MGIWVRALKFLLPLAVIGVATLVAVIVVQNRPEVATQVPEFAPPGVRAYLVEVDTVQVPVMSQGTVRPRTETQLVPEVAGRVTWVAPSFAAGGFFEEGDILLRIDPFDYQQTVISSRSQLAQSRLRLAQEEAEAEVARREWEELGRGDPRSLTLREPHLEDARAGVAAAQAGLIRAQRDLERADLKAPYAGRVRSKTVDVGQFVTVGAAIATIYAVDVAEIRLPLPDEQLAYLDLPLAYRGTTNQDGPRVTLRTTFAGATYEWRGQVVRTEGEIDPVSRMVHVVAEVRDPYAAGPDPNRPPLAVGMYVEAEIEGRAFDEIVVVPRAALQGRDQVLTIDTDSRVWFREIDILRTTTDSVYVRSGLTQGETVATSALDGPTDGMRVQITDLSMAMVADRQTGEATRSPAPVTEASAMPQRQAAPTDAGFVPPARRGRAERPEWLVRVYRESAQATRVARRSTQPRPSGSGPPAAPRVVEAPVSPVSPIVTPPRPRPELSPSAPPIPIDDVHNDIAEDSDLDLVAGASRVVDRATAVAILPFANISQGGTTDALGTGLAQDVLTRLGDLESVVVVSSETDADWVVGGGVQRLGDAVRVTARVVDTRDGDIVRAVKVDGATNDLGRVRGEVAAAIEAGIIEALGIGVDLVPEIDVAPVLNTDVAPLPDVELAGIPDIGAAPLRDAVAAAIRDIDSTPIPFESPTSDRIAVRDFSNVSQMPADAEVAQAIGNAVTEHLLALENVSVVAEESSAAWIIAGGIQRVGNIVRVTASLVDVVTGSVVRAIKVDGLINRLAQLQSEVAAALSNSVREATS